MRCQYYWFRVDPAADGMNPSHAMNFIRVTCPNEATVHTDLPTAVEFGTEDVCEDCFKIVLVTEQVRECEEKGVAP